MRARRFARVRTFLIHARHFCGLTADERAAGLLAALCNALDHLRRDGDVELAAAVVVKEVQRLRALHEQVVHRHSDEVDACKWGHIVKRRAIYRR